MSALSGATESDEAIKAAESTVPRPRSRHRTHHPAPAPPVDYRSNLPSSGPGQPVPWEIEARAREALERASASHEDEAA